MVRILYLGIGVAATGLVVLGIYVGELLGHWIARRFFIRDDGPWGGGT